MDLTITLDTATLDALSAEASARNATREQVVREVVEDYFMPPQSSDPEYDAWFRTRVETGLKEIREGHVVSNEEVQHKAQERRARLQALIAARK